MGRVCPYRRIPPAAAAMHLCSHCHTHFPATYPDGPVRCSCLIPPLLLPRPCTPPSHTPSAATCHVPQLYSHCNARLLPHTSAASYRATASYRGRKCHASAPAAAHLRRPACPPPVLALAWALCPCRSAPNRRSIRKRRDRGSAAAPHFTTGPAVAGAVPVSSAHPRRRQKCIGFARLLCTRTTFDPQPVSTADHRRCAYRHPQTASGFAATCRVRSSLFMRITAGGYCMCVSCNAQVHVVSNLVDLVRVVWTTVTQFPAVSMTLLSIGGEQSGVWFLGCMTCAVGWCGVVWGAEGAVTFYFHCIVFRCAVLCRAVPSGAMARCRAHTMQHSNPQHGKAHDISRGQFIMSQL